MLYNLLITFHHLLPVHLFTFVIFPRAISGAFEVVNTVAPRNVSCFCLSATHVPEDFQILQKLDPTAASIGTLIFCTILGLSRFANLVMKRDTGQDAKFQRADDVAVYKSYGRDKRSL